MVEGCLHLLGSDCPIIVSQDLLHGQVLSLTCCVDLYCVKISPCVSQKRLRFGDDVGTHDFIKFAKKYHQQQEEACTSVGRMVVRAMSPPRLADIGVLLQEAQASRA